MKKFFVLILPLTFFLSLPVSAQSRREELDAEIKAILKARDELMRSLLEDDSFSNFDKRFNDLIQRFEQDSFGSMQGLQMGGVVGEYDWRETPTQLILAIKVKQIKDRPLDIKIEKGFVRLKGEVEEIQEAPGRKTKKISKVHFERSFSIPPGVDQTTPEFENSEGELLIKFKKLKESGSPSPGTPKKKDSEREPVGRESGDAII